MKIGLVLLITSFLYLTSCSQESTDVVQTQTAAVLKRISQKEFMNVLKRDASVQLIDVRTPNEFRVGKISEAINVDFLNPSFESEIQELNKSKLTLIYCQSGGRSANALKKMKHLGFSNVLELKGGYENWQK
jgi:rhodanese-related sulfurtransferase